AAAARGEVAALEANETVSANRDAAASAEDLLARLPDDVRAEVGRYLNGEVDADYYSPERTADRISSFVIDGFARFEGGGAAQENSAEARQRFVDFITPAIDKGFKQALDILEPLHDGVKERVQETRELIGTRMAAFVKEDHVDTVA
ncbi:MAG: DUF5610 domain-containing protein, partial [Phycisphaerae bacterium]|nr:DUF5610 domain-containing protein [Phycisphaerae bacterium]